MNYFSPNETISKIHKIRRVASSSLAAALESLTSFSFSENDLKIAWQNNIRDHQGLAPDGWYVPPPGGISVLIGNPNSFERMRYKSLRHESIWPRHDNRFNQNSILYGYASPFEKSTGLIGDMGVTLYKGTSPKIKAHLNSCLEITYKIADYAKVGMKLSEIFEFGMKVISEKGLSNQTFSVTDPDGLDIGHTIPFSDISPNNIEQQCLKDGTQEEVRQLISSKRRFINKGEKHLIQPNIAFTIEPRLSSDSLPLASFHVIVTFCKGKKNIVSGFHRLFELFNMDQFITQDNLIIFFDESNEFSV